MNENLGRGYARIEGFRASHYEMPFTCRNGMPPQDRYHGVYITLMFGGIAFLLPFNSFIMAVDYFQLRYPNSPIMFDITTVYIAAACVAVVLNNMLLDFFSYNTRVTSGIFISIVTMVFVAICNVGGTGLSIIASYDINLMAVIVVAFGCTIQQASYYGFAGCLPPRYTQAVMAGESAAGLWACIDRIATKVGLRQSTRSTFLFFLFSVVVIVIHCIMHFTMMRQPFVQYYLQLTNELRQRKRIQLHLNPNEEITLVQSETGEATYGILKLQSPPTSIEQRQTEEVPDEIVTHTLSFSNPVYTPTSAPESGAQIGETSNDAAEPHAPPLNTPRPSYKVEDIVLDPPERHNSWKDFKSGVLSRWVVTRAIYPYMVSIGLVYFTTLSLYPGIASEIHSCRLGNWMPIILMTCFNFFDLMGKIAAAWPYEWRTSQLLMASGLRLLLVPLLLLCAAPRRSPHIVGDIYPILFSVALGFTNGLFGSVPMILAPSRVARENREISGNMMTLSYNGGLLSGALVSYLLLGMLGPRGESACSHTYPTPLLPTAPPFNHSINVTYIAH